jgi:hypothetical protein
MFTLAAGKARTGRALGNPVLSTEGRVTLIDGILAAAVLAGLILNAALGWLARAFRCGQCARTRSGWLARRRPGWPDLAGSSW